MVAWVATEETAVMEEMVARLAPVVLEARKVRQRPEAPEAQFIPVDLSDTTLLRELFQILGQQALL
jgi:hypothetical protein